MHGCLARMCRRAHHAHTAAAQLKTVLHAGQGHARQRWTQRPSSAHLTPLPHCAWATPRNRCG